MTVVSQGARGRKLYDVTAAGREELRARLLSPPSDRGTVRNEFVLRLFLLSSLEPDEAAALLDEVEAFAERQIDVLEKERADLAGAVSGPVYAAAYGIFAYTATRDWARWARDHLGSVDGTRASGDGPGSART